MDWGLLEVNSPKPLLRANLTIERYWIYYVSMFLNLVFRITWIATISPASFGINLAGVRIMFYNQ